MNHGIHSFQRGLYSTIAGLKDELRKRLDQELPDLENNRLLILFNQTRFDDTTTLDHIREQFEVTEQLDMMAVGKLDFYSGVPHSLMPTELFFDVILMMYYGSQQEQFFLYIHRQKASISKKETFWWWRLFWLLRTDPIKRYKWNRFPTD